ncbi:hypothetical protein OHB54_45465 [Streptomyces sp. NBC_01007]|nr:hypothetical protein OHB54_45465 [Streptomyces sp. NBC_01007]
MDFSGATFSSSVVSFSGARFSGAVVFFDEARGPAPEGLLAAVGTPAPATVTLPWLP